METIKKLLSHEEITNEWQRSDMNPVSAKFLTLNQVTAFENIVEDDKAWELLLSVFNNGRNVDAWLALDWPDGFDELLLCVPLCKLVEFECCKCTIGKRQDNNSCANDYSLFGYIAELLKTSDREGLRRHVNFIKKMLTDEKYKWNLISQKTEV